MTPPDTRAKELAGLIEIVEKATGGHDEAATDLRREIEYRIVSLLISPEEALLHEIHGIAGYRITTSVDAALALVERVLPGWMWYVGSVGENDMPQATITEPVEDCRDFVGHATTAPLAILLAMLKAIQESQDAE